MRRTRIDWRTQPVGLVTTRWLAARLKVSHGLIAAVMRQRGGTKLPVRDAILFGSCPSSYATWVDAWGLAPVLAWLDRYAPTDAAYVREHADRIHDRARDLAEAEARHAEALARKESNRRIRRLERRAALHCHDAQRAPSGSPKAQARRAALLDSEPVGYVADSVLAELGIATRYTLEMYRSDRQIRASGLRRGKWEPLIAAWGVDRAREWVTRRMPSALPAFEAAAKPPVPVRLPAIDTAKVDSLVARARERTEPDNRRPFLPPREMHAPTDKEAERRFFAEKLAEFKARGGVVTFVPSTVADGPLRVAERDTWGSSLTAGLRGVDE